MPVFDLSIVILNWNGKHLLVECLPSVIEAALCCGKKTQIIVVDNNSSDGSRQFLKENFPFVKVLALSDNFGFAKGMNEGARAAEGNILIGLNNDVLVEKDFILPLISHFTKDKKVFAAACKMLMWDRKTLNFGRAVGRFKLGIFRKIYQEPGKATTALYACGGAFAATREKFLELGGFDEDMIVYWEDMDICYRAWKQGYKTIYEPSSIVYHKFHATYEAKCGIKGIRRISGENYFLFALKNFHDKSLFIQQFFSLPFLLLAAPILGKSHFSLGLLRSFKRFPLFLKKRKIEREKSILSDRQVLLLSSQ